VSDTDPNRRGLPDYDSSTTVGELVPPGYTVLDYTMQVKALNPEGEVVMITVKTPSLAPWEAYGMVMSHTDDIATGLASRGCSCDDD
jgi:hypothetical protein